MKNLLYSKWILNVVLFHILSFILVSRHIIHDDALWQLRNNLFVISVLDGSAIRRARRWSGIFVKIPFGAAHPPRGHDETIDRKIFSNRIKRSMRAPHCLYKLAACSRNICCSSIKHYRNTVSSPTGTYLAIFYPCRCTVNIVFTPPMRWTNRQSLHVVWKRERAARWLQNAIN